MTEWAPDIYLAPILKWGQTKIPYLMSQELPGNPLSKVKNREIDPHTPIALWASFPKSGQQNGHQVTKRFLLPL